jgi:hypothetical protein
MDFSEHGDTLVTRPGTSELETAGVQKINAAKVIPPSYDSGMRKVLV